MQQGQQPPGHGGLVPVADPSAAPGRPRVPVSARAISRSVGYPAKPIRYRIRPSQQRLRPVSGTFTELQPSKATVRSPPNRTPR